MQAPKRLSVLSGFTTLHNSELNIIFLGKVLLKKKNWMFAGSERAGKRAAAIQTLLATAKANGIEPLAWLKDTLEKLPSCLSNRIDELLPLRS